MPSTDSSSSSSANNKAAARSPEGTRIGDYILEGTIGSGGMGVVYRARQISMKRIVALKVLKAELTADARYMARFFTEVRLLAQMSHPNIVQVIEGGMDDGTAFFSMEYVDGRDLAEILENGGRFSVNEVLSAAYQTASALSYAWNKFSMIHRDVKPANIIVSSPGTIKLLDLGISKRISPLPSGGPDSPCLTAHNEMVGSPAYVSPEQAANEPGIDFRADIYSLGVTMYQLLTGVLPYDAKNSFEVVTMHFNSPIPNVRKLRPEVPRRVASLIRRMMAKDRACRFDSWESLMLELRELLYGFRASRPRGFARSVRLALTKVMPFVAVLSILVMVAVVVYASLAIVLMDSVEAVPQRPHVAEGVIVDVVESEPEPSEEEVERLYRQKRDDFIEILEKRSRELEARGEFSEALKMWTEDLTLPEDFASDPVFQTRLEISVNYLKRKLAKLESGLDE